MELSPEELASLNKHRPNNETGKRFVLSPEAFAKERLSVLKDEVDKIKEKYPEVLSLCLFGSMVKGTAHKGSDIDGYLFIDAEKISKQEEISEESLLEKVSGETYFSEEVSKKYSSELRGALKDRLGLDDEFFKHIRTRPISERIIEMEILKFIEYKKDKADYDSSWNVWYDNQPPRGSSIEKLIEHQKSKPENPERVRSHLSDMFHLDLGGDIRKYKIMLIEKLSQLGEDGENIWSELIKQTEMIENNLNYDDTKRYPRTLKEAASLYGVKARN